ncbi:MAG TPA: DUF2244 domain-containing protein [Steroidobacteraceae bacterium]|nr:DUF2244 domain-containing protein [Steroidobacteraceae bacterium]
MSEPYLLVLTPRCALTPASARVFIAIVGGTCFAVAGVVAAQGFWPVLPFAGLEIGLLAWAVRASMREGSRRETIEIDEQRITIRRSDRRGEHFSVFPRHGSRVTLRTPQTALHPSRLVLESRGRVCEVGRFLTEDARQSLAARLQQLVGNVNEPPALG